MQAGQPRATEAFSSFTVRPLPSSAILEGAFRVHIGSRDLEGLRLKPGDLCNLATQDGNIGTGIAWRSIEQNTKAQSHPVKLSDTIRDAFGFKLGNQMTISRASKPIAHVDRVTIIDVSDNDAVDASRDDGSWKWECGQTLSRAEAIANGVAFEASTRKGLRRRFLIDRIESQTDEPGLLYRFDDKSDLVIQESKTSPLPQPALQPLFLTSEGIGGLQKQIQALNQQLVWLIGEYKGRKLPIQSNGGILLYGAEGTGKSLLLSRLAQAQWRKVVKIDQSVLPGTTTKNQAAIRSAVAAALAQQPSLIVMDDVHRIAGSQQGDSISASMAPVLADELDSLKDSQVLVVATATTPNAVDKTLRAPDRLEFEIEIPIPDMKARTDILRVLHKQHNHNKPRHDELAEDIGELTHGYVGKDLRSLYRKMLRRAVLRHMENEDWVHIDGGVQNYGSDGARLTIPVGGDGREPEHTDSIGQDTSFDILREDYDKALREVRPSAMKEVFLETPEVYWEDIGGSKNVKDTLTEVIEWPLKYSSLMEELNLVAQQGVLLYGPPGCSKTLTAKAVATSSGLNFIAVKGAELTSMYVGESERAIREVFRKARAASPSIIFFDEIDSIAAERDSAGTKGLNVLTTILNEMDGIESLKGVIVLAATNKPEILDPALLRPGRFDSLMYIGPPDETARLEILKIKSGKVPLAADVDLVDLARRTDGYSGAEVVEICMKAARELFRRRVAATGSEEGRPVITKADFEAALSTTKRQITPQMVAGYVDWRDGRRGGL